MVEVKLLLYDKEYKDVLVRFSVISGGSVLILEVKVIWILIIYWMVMYSIKKYVRYMFYCRIIV